MHRFPFDGDIYTLSELGVKMECDDRDIRKRATQAYWGWMQSHQDEIDDLYDRMVKVMLIAWRKKLAIRIMLSWHICCSAALITSRRMWQITAGRFGGCCNVMQCIMNGSGNV